MQIQPWNSGSLRVTAAVEQLARVEEPVLTEKQENTAQQQPQTTVKYVSADKVVQIEWTRAVEGEDAATEGSSSGEGHLPCPCRYLPCDDLLEVQRRSHSGACDPLFRDPVKRLKTSPLELR